VLVAYQMALGSAVARWSRRSSCTTRNRTQLPGANLTGTDLVYADLTYANLSGATLAGATLSRAKCNSGTKWPNDTNGHGSTCPPS
jgi:uncharacterized protein YjbI with pentapeptide repeats